jgi:polysaccharide export outer membrane protein
MKQLNSRTESKPEFRPFLSGILGKVLAACILLVTFTAAHGQESLLIGPGDQISITVYDAAELDQHVRVSDSGDIALIIGGTVKVAGLTPAQAASVISAYMVNAHYLVNPRIAVSVDSYATQLVSVLGDVKNPGAYPIVTGRNISDILALAGGLMPDADRTVVVQRHSTGEMLTFYTANQPLTTPDSSAPGTTRAGATQLLSREVLVYPGDTVRVAHAELVYVLGDVGKPGGFPIVNNDANLTALQLVSLAGGTNHTAVPSHARLIRKLPDGKFEDIHLPLSAMQKGHEADRPLQAGDIIYVPFSYLRNAFLGAAGIAGATGGAAIYVTH